MIVACTSCSARFQYGEDRFQGARFKRFKCPKCSVIFEVQNPSLTLPPDPITPPPPKPLAAPSKPAETTSRSPREGLLSKAGLSVPPGTRFSLAFLTGPHASTVRVLDQPVTIIGREEGDVIIHDPETSRRHAKLEIYPDGTVWLSDLASTNGTFSEGNPITGPTQLMDRQEFSCGRSMFMLLIREVDSMSLD